MGEDRKVYAVPVSMPQLVAMVNSKIEGTFTGSWYQKLLWVLRRVFLIARSWFYDTEYLAIPKWLAEELLEHWKNDVLSHLRYIGEGWDCDDFSKVFEVWFKCQVTGQCPFMPSVLPEDKRVPGFNGIGGGVGYVYSNGSMLGGHRWSLLLLVDDDGVPGLWFAEAETGELFLGPRDSRGYWYRLFGVLM